MLPAEVVSKTAASPIVKSSAALDTVSKDNTPEPLVVKNCPLEPSAVGSVYVISAACVPT